jgi:Protein kinase domain
VSAPDEIAADVILDGAPVDWPSTEARCSDAQRELLTELRVLAALADLHGQIPFPLDSSSRTSTTSTDVVAAGQWGPLRVLEQIGGGSFGTVYRAWDQRLDREVALKLLPVRSIARRGDATSVIQEGRLLARVRHPNVVAVYGAEQIENWIGLWMEFIGGETLERAIESGRAFSVADATNIGIDLCDAVAAVHGAGLLHRDIKAHNVALEENGRVVLMDFGAGLASLDGRLAPRQISTTDDDHPMFAPNGEIIFRASEQGANFIYRVKPDGTGRTKLVPTPMLALASVSPDGRWVLALAPVSGGAVTAAVWAYPTDGGPPVRVCDVCKASWSRDGRRWYLSEDDGRTYVIALREDNGLPDLPDSGVRSTDDLAKLSVLQVIDQRQIAPGRDDSRYAFVRTTVLRNLYRIPLR